nr:retrovirus-related Pol polyprotein from transposon TNT 1-94 [Tanacetum cinerariifolium]
MLSECFRTCQPVTSSVPTEVKNNEKESKINELTKLVQMLIDEKVNSSQKIQESKLVIPQSESSKSVNSSKTSQDHRTSDHNMYVASLKNSKNYKAQPYQYASPSKQILKAKAKPFPPCILGPNTIRKRQNPSKTGQNQAQSKKRGKVNISRAMEWIVRFECLFVR